ncbi:MAG: hypothetical protein JSS49_04815 [Planctomycetes bacterium]|nr:hypothetical protein [Planctomycetota bacterium]
MMKNRFLAGTIAIIACCSLIGLAQEGSKPAATKLTQAEKPKGRLPANYGKLGLTDKQKTAIYGIQAKYESQLDDLQKQLDDLKAKRDAEVKTVLNDNQRKALDDLVAEAKAKKEKNRPEADSAAKTDAPKDEKK